MMHVYKDVIFYWVFQNGTIKKIQPIWVYYGENHWQVPKHQYDDCIIGLNFPVKIVGKKVNRKTAFYT